MPQKDIPQNDLLLKVLTILLGIVGTLLTVICVSIMSKIDNLQLAMDKLSPVVLTHTGDITQLKKDVDVLQHTMNDVCDFKTKFTTLYALKPDEIRIRRQHHEANE